MGGSTAEIAGDYEALIQFLYIAPVGLVQASLDGEIAMINPISAQLLMPLSRDADLINLFTALESVAPDLRQRVAHFGHPYGMVCDQMRIRVTPGGDDRSAPQTLALSLLKLDEHRMMAVLNDVSQQVARERMLKQNEAWLNAILAGVTDYAIVRLDALGRIVEWNASIGRITGFGRAAVVGQPFSIFYPDGATTADRVLDRLHEAEESGWSLDDGWRLKADGTRFWGSAMISPLRERPDPEAPGHGPGDPVQQAYCLVIRDITEKRAASETQRRSTSCDLLTGIANRRAFFEAAEIELARARWSPRPLSLVRFEADAFDDIVATHGRAAGDALLQHIAERMSEVFREVDVVARLGRESFAILLPSTDLTGAGIVAERLRSVVAARPLQLEGGSMRCSVTGGIVTVDGEAISLDALMRRADDALDDAKAAGCDRVACWSAQSRAALA